MIPMNAYCSMLIFGFAAASMAAETPVEFNRDIRPILSDNCFACHGPDEKERKAGFRIDLEAGALARLDHGPAILPGKPEDSEVFRRISTPDEDELMPPPESGKALSPEQIDLIQRWIAQGAAWQEHWSFTPPVRPGEPEVEAGDWVRSPIDRFILARLEREGLAPESDADQRTLLRRVSLDLNGLPPTRKEIRAFLDDPSANAYEKVVDRLLASTRYGEHMARYWLDAARYGDTHGLHLDNYREIWPYRDWVIKAYNRNLPFDRFTIEQLAGDLLPNPTLDQRIATGFNRCHVTTGEGGSIDEEYYVRYAVDRTETVGTVWLGLSVGCAGCHDHKYDPVSQKEFYRMYAYFNNITERAMDGNKKAVPPIVKVPLPGNAEKLKAIDERIADLERRLAGEWPEVDKAQVEWEQSLLTTVEQIPTWTVLKPEVYTSSGGAKLRLLEDRSVLAAGANPAKDVYELAAPLPEGRWTALRLEGLVHHSLPHKGAGRSENSNVVLSEFEAEVADEPGAWTRLKFVRAWADHEQGDGPFKVVNAIDGKAGTGWAIDGHRRRENRQAIFQAEAPFSGGRIKVRLRQESPFARHQFGRVRVALTEAENIPEVKPGPPEELLAIVKAADRSPGQQAQLRTYYRRQVVSLGPLVDVRDQIDRARKEKANLEKQAVTTMVMQEREQPRGAYVLERGQYDQRREPVQPGVPAVLPKLGDDAPNNRLGFARWLMRPDHPLTARVTVNRYWQQLFGTGLVKTSEDFGNQGERPTHPALLDWLATEYIRLGWDTKQLLKTMVMSSTYRQSARVSREKILKDPENRLMSRGPRFRLDGETIRDQALFLSGLLVDMLGGPSVKPPQPDGLWYAVGYSGSNTVRFRKDAGADKVYRRSLYTFFKRTSPPPQLDIFDAPSRETCTVRRERTNTPLQCLMLMNDPQYVEAARAFAERLLREDESDEARIEVAFEMATGRLPSTDEKAELMAVLKKLQSTYQADLEAARQLIAIGEQPPSADLDPSLLAAYTVLANILLNLDEVITKG
ncbi:MAG: PSD1 and planctomycete cytochrome C domain-containing protein [Verrucomicrobiota bacterium]